jgi:hypothetical protein
MFERNLLPPSTLKMEAVGSSGMLVDTSNIIWCMNLEDQHLSRSLVLVTELLSNFVI